MLRRKYLEQRASEARWAGYWGEKRVSSSERAAGLAFFSPAPHLAAWCRVKASTRAEPLPRLISAETSHSHRKASDLGAIPRGLLFLGLLFLFFLDLQR